MKKKLIAAAVVLGAFAIYAAAAPDVIGPAPAWDPPEPPPLEGLLAENTILQRARLVGRGQFVGPESVAIDAEGRIFTGVSDGRIVRVDLESDKIVPFTQTGTRSAGCGDDANEATCGRPLGMIFDAAGNLIVADAARGLLSISRSGGVRVLTSSAGGVPFRFTDDLDIARDGRIYFSDASSKYDRAHYREDIVEGNPWGRLLRYDPATKQTEVLLDGLYFANGVQLAHDESFVLVAETGRYRIQRYWIAGPKAGTAEMFAENLPGIPDNVRRAKDGGWWVAMGAKRSGIVDFMHPRPTFKRIFTRVMPLALVQKYLVPKIGLVVLLDAEGRPMKALWDPSGQSALQLSEAHEHDGRLFLGSIGASHLAVLDLAGI